jgi:hypothetical protein
VTSKLNDDQVADLIQRKSSDSIGGMITTYSLLSESNRYLIRNEGKLVTCFFPNRLLEISIHSIQQTTRHSCKITTTVVSQSPPQMRIQSFARIGPPPACIATRRRRGCSSYDLCRDVLLPGSLQKKKRMPAWRFSGQVFIFCQLTGIAGLRGPRPGERFPSLFLAKIPLALQISSSTTGGQLVQNVVSIGAEPLLLVYRGA